MARGKRKSVKEQIAVLEAKKSEMQAKIQGIQTKITAINDQIKALETKDKEAELETLLDQIRASGMTPAEILANMTSPKQDNQSDE